MQAKKVSQLTLAALSGNSQTTVLRLLQAHNVKVATLADIAGAMGCRLRIELVPEEES
jgi:transcriptional regulator with XRE-family HTH domain